MTTVDIDVLDEIEIEDAPEVFPLAAAEQQALERCEAVIGQGRETFLQVGAALSEIQQGKLYRTHYDTFEEYCRDRWDIGRGRAYQLIGASKITAELSMADNPPKNEREAREIAKAAPGNRQKVLERADQLAGIGPRTGTHIERAVREIAAARPIGFRQISLFVTPPDESTPDATFQAYTPPQRVVSDESALCRALIGHLTNQGYRVDSQVACAAGVADVVTDDAIFEVKYWLTRDQFVSAIGQVLLYRQAINPSACAVIVGYISPSSQIGVLIEYASRLGVEVWQCNS